MIENNDVINSLAQYVHNDAVMEEYVQKVADKHGEAFRNTVLDAVVFIGNSIENAAADAGHGQRNIEVMKIVSDDDDIVDVTFAVVDEYTGISIIFDVAFWQGEFMDEIASYVDSENHEGDFGLSLAGDDSYYETNLNPMLFFIDEQLDA